MTADEAKAAALRIYGLKPSEYRFPLEVWVRGTFDSATNEGTWVEIRLYVPDDLEHYGLEEE